MAVSTNLRGIGAVLLATGAFVANDSCMKLAWSDAPPFQVLVMRGIAACLWCLPVVLFAGFGRDLPKTFNRWVLLRSFSEVFAILSFILALAKMPIADVTAIARTALPIVLIGTWLIWGDKIGTLRIPLPDRSWNYRCHSGGTARWLTWPRLSLSSASSVPSVRLAATLPPARYRAERRL